MDQVIKNRIAYAELLNRCWDEPEYLERFREDPESCLKEYGIDAPPEARYHIVAPEDMQMSTDEDVYLYYMEKPATGELDEEALEKVAGGGWFWTSSNILVNSNAMVDGTAVGESIAVAVTIVAVAVIG